MCYTQEYCSTPNKILRRYHEPRRHIAKRSDCYFEESIVTINTLHFIVLIMNFRLEFINLFRNFAA
jgi:hypothetical protein